jgi:hypothetical protein
VLQKLWERVETKKDSFGARTEFHTRIWGGQNDIEQIQNQVWLPVKICDDWRKGRFVHVDTAIMRYYDKQFMPGLFSCCTINNTMGLEKNERRRDETRHNKKYEDARQFTTAPSKPRTLFDSDLKTLATYQTGIAALWGPLFPHGIGLKQVQRALAQLCRFSSRDNQCRLLGSRLLENLWRCIPFFLNVRNR